MRDAPQNTMGSSAPTRQDLSLPPSDATTFPHGSSPSLHCKKMPDPSDQLWCRGAGSVTKATAPGMLQHHWARGQKDIPSLAAPSLKGPISHEIPHVPSRGRGSARASVPGGERRRMKRRPCLGASEQPRGSHRGPNTPVQPSNSSLITRHGGGMEALAHRRQSPRRYHRNNPYPAQASKGFVRVPMCASPSPPSRPSPCCFCVWMCDKEGWVFFSSPGSVCHQGSDHVKSKQGETDGQTEWRTRRTSRDSHRAGGG